MTNTIDSLQRGFVKGMAVVGCCGAVATTTYVAGRALGFNRWTVTATTAIPATAGGVALAVAALAGATFLTIHAAVIISVRNRR